MDKQPFYLIQIILSIILIGLIILQAKGSGLGSTFGSSFAFYSSRRGVEKLLFKLTIVISVVFFAISALTLLL